jgi:cytochrome c2
MAELEQEVVEIAFADVYATADAGAGERLWRQCQACHALNPGQNGVGPYLHGVVGRPKHSAEGFSYSDALLSQDGDWTPENLAAFLENPRGYAPGTAMAYQRHVRRGRSRQPDRLSRDAAIGAEFQRTPAFFWPRGREVMQDAALPDGKGAIRDASARC